jgi:hypothetical protein
MSVRHSPPLLFEMMKSFASLARTLNLSKTVRNLNSTRQTVRRHIALLEEIKGEPLFSLEDRQYHLTDAGKRALREAETLVARGEAWLNNDSGHVRGLQHLASENELGFPFYLQQHPLSVLWRDGSALMRFGFRCWAAAEGEIENPAFAPVRPYLMIFRQLGADYICVEVGESSSYATWYGWRWERSSVGRGVADMPGGPGFANLLMQPFQDVLTSDSVRLDHIHTQVKKAEGEERLPISYQRLLMGCRFPDGSQAVAALVDRTYNIDILGMPEGLARTMPKHLLMDVAPPPR